MAVEAGDIEFKSQLDERSRKRARDELNELNDKDRELAVQSFRQWVLQQKWLQTPIDFGFLLRFLRGRKFSQLLARETLENYWTARTTAPEWFRNVDPSDPTIQEILRSGVFVSPKAYDKEGRRLFIQAFGKIDLDVLKNKWGLATFFKAVVLVLDWVNTDENVQVNGLLGLIDSSNGTIQHVRTIWTSEHIKRILHYFNNMPKRGKGLHFYNEPIFFDAVFPMFAQFMKQKQKDRMHLHGRSLVDVYKYIDQEILPEEYLPDDYKGSKMGSITSMIEEMIEDMNGPVFRSYIMDLSSEKYGVDLQYKEENVPSASFRKLNVD